METATPGNMRQSTTAACRVDRPLRLCFFGAAPDTGNHGVTALCLSTLAGVLRRVPGAEITVFDHGRACRSDTVVVGNGCFPYVRLGASHTRRVWRPECLWNMRVRGWLGGLGSEAVEAIRRADAVLDVSAGDSFSDLYGRHRFRSIALHKLLALEQGIPLVLLPQTYGPFRRVSFRRLARGLVSRASMAWARDGRSFGELRELLGPWFDSRRHLQGVDLAFGLEPREPRAGLPPLLKRWLEQGERPLVGFNVSGLVYHDPQEAQRRYGLRTDYRRTVEGFLRRLLEERRVRLVLVPHVAAPPGHPESDLQAAQAVARLLESEAPGRVVVLPEGCDAQETKWLISRLDWFCGTRMHSTIAALSSGVPAAGLAYSLKAAGVFECCRLGDQVVDMRSCGTGEAVERLLSSWRFREVSRARLGGALPGVKAQSEAQMDRILEAAGVRADAPAALAAEARLA